MDALMTAHMRSIITIERVVAAVQWVFVLFLACHSEKRFLSVFFAFLIFWFLRCFSFCVTAREFFFLLCNRLRFDDEGKKTWNISLKFIFYSNCWSKFLTQSFEHVSRGVLWRNCFFFCMFCNSFVRKLSERHLAIFFRFLSFFIYPSHWCSSFL